MFTRKEVIVLGMMIFALFLGAGNIIFPPMEGFLAGKFWFPSAIGFVLTGVIMPFITLLVVALIGGGEKLTKDLPRWISVSFWAVLYLVIGSFFAMPRVTNVAYEMGWVPLQLTSASLYDNVLFAFVFNLMGMFFMLKHTSIVTTIGKYLTPMLLILLVVVSVLVVCVPLSEVSNSQEAPNLQGLFFTKGLVSGYQTMDVLAATAFGGIVVRVFLHKRIHSKRMIFKYTLLSGLISVALLTCLYFALFYMGATSSTIASDAENGGQIFSKFVGVQLGMYGVWVMSGIVILANITTLVGVQSASANYFASLSPRLNYIFWVVLFTFLTALISVVKLNVLLQITIPALLLIYPIAIMLVVLQLIYPLLCNPKLIYRWVFATALVFGGIDALKYLELLSNNVNKYLSHIPLYDESLAWLLPSCLVLLLSCVWSAFRSKKCSKEIQR